MVNDLRPASSRSSATARAARRSELTWLTISQLCRRWQLSRKTIYKFINSGLLPAWKVGKHLYRVDVADALRFERRNKVPPK